MRTKWYERHFNTFRQSSFSPCYCHWQSTIITYTAWHDNDKLQTHHRILYGFQWKPFGFFFSPTQFKFPMTIHNSFYEPFHFLSWNFVDHFWYESNIYYRPFNDERIWFRFNNFLQAHMVNLTTEMMVSERSAYWARKRETINIIFFSHFQRSLLLHFFYSNE